MKKIILFSVLALISCINIYGQSINIENENISFPIESEIPIITEKLDNNSQENLLALVNGNDIDLSKIYGKIQFVTSFPDYKVKIVDSFPDLKVKIVTSFPDSAGKWQIVDSFPDYKIQIVESFPDFTIKYVDSFPSVN